MSAPAPMAAPRAAGKGRRQVRLAGRFALVLVTAVALIVLGGWAAWRLYASVARGNAPATPIATFRRKMTFSEPPGVFVEP